MDWRELQEEVKKRQTGIDDSLAPEIDWDDPEALESYKSKWRAERGLSEPFDFSTYRDREHAIQAYKQDNPVDLNALADAVGYGQNRRDWRYDVEDFAMNPQNYRANAQSQANKVINGLIKALPTAATTYADDTVGLLAALLGYTPVGRLIADARDGDGKFSLSSAIPNPFSKDEDPYAGHFSSTSFGEWMQAVRDKMEEIFPNYRTEQEELDKDEWWKHLNGNFFGDVFLKNLGFTIGAGYAGKTWANLFRGSQGKLVNEAYKAAVTAASKGENEIEAFRKVLQGAALENPQKVYKQLSDISKTFNRLGWQSQMIGAIGGATGEARTEALSAAKEFRDEQFADIMNDYRTGRDEIMDTLASNPEFWEERPVFDGFGNIVDTEYVLNQDGQDYKDSQLAMLRDKMESTKATAENEAERLANGVFWMNVPLLVASNAVMFGKMFKGGFRTQSNARFRGKAGELKGVGSKARAIASGFGAAATEGMEELTQKIFSEGEKDISSKNMAAFYDGKYDTDSIKDVASWLLSMANTANEVVTQGSSWEEFAIGALTGGMGHVTNFTRTDKGNLKWDPVGGFVGAYREGIRQRDENRKLAEKINERYNDPDFQNLWSGMVRHKKYDKIKDAALDKNQKFVWKTADDAQMLNDVMMFADAGRLNDLEGYIDAFTRLSEDEVHEFRDMFSDETDPEFQNKTDRELRDWIKERADEVKTTIEQYRDFHDSIDFLSLGTSDKDVIDEMVFTAAQLENFEKRYQKLASDVWEKIRPTVVAVSNEKTKKGEPTKRAEEASKILENSTDTMRIFGALATDISDRGMEERSIASMISKVQDDLIQQNTLEQLEKWGAFASNPKLKEEVADLQKLVRARQNYYAKLFDPMFRQKFEEQKKSPVEEAGKLQENDDIKTAQAHVEQLDKANTLQDFVRIYSSLDPATENVENEENKLIAANKKLAAFDKQLEQAETFVDTLRREVDKKAEKAEDEDLPMWEFIAGAITENMASDSILKADVDENPLVAISREFINAVQTSPLAEAEVRQILQDKLQDVATANGLGVMPKPTTTSTASESTPVVTDTGTESPSAETPSEQPVQGEQGSNDTNPQVTTPENPVPAQIPEPVPVLAGGVVNPPVNPTGGIVAPDIVSPEDIESSEELVRAFDMLDKVSSPSSKEFSKIVNGDFSSYPKLNTQDKLMLLGEAMRKYKEFMAQRGEIAVQEGSGRVDSDEKAKKVRDAQFAKRREQSVDGSPFSIEDPAAAKEQGKRLPFLPKRSSDGLKETQAWFRNHKVQAFLNSGALADIDEAFRKAGQTLPIYYVANPHYVENNQSVNPFVISGGKVDKAYNPFGLSMSTVLLAIDMNETVPGTNKTIREYLKRYEDAGLFSDMTLLPVTEDGSVHKYQVVGAVLTRPDKYYKDKNQSVPESEQGARLMWEHAVRRSIFPQYYSDVEKEGGSGNISKEGKWYVARIHPETDTQETDTHKADWTTGRKINTTLNYIGTGRKETTAPSNSKPEKTLLSTSLKEYRALGKPYHWAIITNDEPMYSPGSPQFPLGAINAAPGSLWIATQNADNSWTWEKVTVALMNEPNVANVFDIHKPKDEMSSMTRRLDDALDVILAPSDPTLSKMEQKQDFENRLQQIRLLDDMFFLGTGNTFHLVFEWIDGKPATNLMVGGANCYTKDDVVSALQDARYRFQVTQQTISDPENMDELIDNGVLSAEMNSFVPIAANIGVNKLSDRDAENNTVDVHALQPNKTVSVIPSLEASLSRGRGDNSVWFGTVRYKVNPDGTVSEWNSNEPTTSKVITSAVKVGQELIELDQAGMTEAFSGKRWLVEDPGIMYVEMYEKEVNGIDVRVVRRGRNGTFTFQFDDAEWDALLQVAEEQATDTNEYGEHEPEANEQEMYEAYNQTMASEEGGQAAPKETKQGRRRRPSSNMQEQKEKDDNDDVTQDCEFQV